MRFCWNKWRSKTGKCCIVFMIVSLLCIRPFVMFWIDTMMNTSYDVQCLDCNNSVNRINYIPRIIHQVFFYISDDEIPEKLQTAQRSWHLFNPDFQYILWNSSMVDNLIKQHYPSQWKVYRSYSHWVQRADFARYIILHYHGGIYADIDIACSKSLSVVNRTLPSNAEFVMYKTRPLGISNDFLMSKPRHPFITSVINGLSNANRWYLLPYLTVFFSTGPFYLYGRYKAYQKKDDILILNSVESFVRHKSGASWHQYDGRLMWWIYIHRGFLFSYTLSALLICGVAISLLILWKARTCIRRNVRRCRNTV